MFIKLTFLVIYLGFYQSAFALSTATRSLPWQYRPSVVSTVSINTLIDLSDGVYAIEESPPLGWVISDVDNGGAWDKK